MLTKEERQAVVRMLTHEPVWFNDLFFYGAYLLPTVFIALYALWRADFAASLVAYGSLLFVVLWYLSYSKSYTKALCSALQKYEAAVGALNSTDEKAI